jgi:2-keto-3-deoxy-L-rhamnonate aldolase RhmA
MSWGSPKEKLRRGEPALGGRMMIAHPAVAEIMAGEGFDRIEVCLEHTSIDIRAFSDTALALKGMGVDLLARLSFYNEVHAKLVLDGGDSDIIVPSVNTSDHAQHAAAMAKFPPEECRAFRCTGPQTTAAISPPTFATITPRCW